MSHILYRFDSALSLPYVLRDIFAREANLLKQPSKNTSL